MGPQAEVIGGSSRRQPVHLLDADWMDTPLWRVGKKRLKIADRVGAMGEDEEDGGA